MIRSRHLDRDSYMQTALLSTILMLGVLIAPSAASADGNVTGRRVIAPPERIVSLAPSMTEILFSLGLDSRIVGVTSFCDQPEEAKKKQKIGGMSNPSLEAVVSLRPDIVVMTTDGNPREFEERLRLLKIPTYVWSARTIDELPAGIRTLGYSLGVGERADELAQTIEKALADRQASGVRREGKRIAQKKGLSSTLPRAPHDSRKRVLFIVWPEPLIVAGPGTAIDDAFTLLGVRNIASPTKATYPKYSLEEVIYQAPDVIFVGRGHVNMKDISRGLLKKLSMVPAVRNGAVCYVSDSLYRLGPRVIRGIEELEKCLD